jgi:hypothetical protein
MSSNASSPGRDWSAYNKALIERGSLTVRIDEEALALWAAPDHPFKPGRPYVFSATAIQFMLTLREVYHLPLRAAQGFVGSIFRIMGVGLKVPHYSTLSRRAGTLEVDLGASPAKGPKVIPPDSTGLKVYGEGEWKVRQHGYSKRRTWRKLHLAIDAKTQEIVAAVTTTNAESDASVVDEILDEIDAEVGELKADGAYDQRGVYKTLKKRKIRAVIPPRKNAKIHEHGNKSGPREMRDENLREIRKHGRKRWKRRSGYHERSLAETAMFRVKTLTGEKLRHRKLETQETESRMKCRVINRVTRLGLLVSKT